MGKVGLVMSIPFLMIGMIFLVVGFLARSWSFVFFITFMTTGAMFFLPGFIFLMLWLHAPKAHDKWWDSLSGEQQNFYLSLGGDVKQLYEMSLEGKLPGIRVTEGSTEESSVDGLQIREDNFPVSPELIRNLGEYIAGSGINIDEFIRQKADAADDMTLVRSALQNESKEEVLAEYKEIVKRVWSDGQLNESEKAVLDHLRARDEITMEDHRKIENEILSNMIEGGR